VALFLAYITPLKVKGDIQFFLKLLYESTGNLDIRGCR